MIDNVNDINRVLFALEALQATRSRIPRRAVLRYLNGEAIYGQNPPFDPILEFAKRFLIAINAGMAQVMSPILPILYSKILRASVSRFNNSNRHNVSKKKFSQCVYARTRSNSNRTLGGALSLVILPGGDK